MNRFGYRTMAISRPISSTTVIAAWRTFLGVHLGFQHANLDYRLGPLRRWLGFAEIHRGHHKREFEDAQVNLLSSGWFGTVCLAPFTTTPRKFARAMSGCVIRHSHGRIGGNWRGRLCDAKTSRNFHRSAALVLAPAHLAQYVQLWSPQSAK